MTDLSAPHPVCPHCAAVGAEREREAIVEMLHDEAMVCGRSGLRDTQSCLDAMRLKIRRRARGEGDGDG